MTAFGGVLPILKPPGPSSHQVVVAVRRRLGRAWRVGHAGTLDPTAAGVLPVCVGPATRLAEYLQLPLKAYRFELILGVETDTQDATGRAIARADAGSLDRPRVEAALPAFVGEVRQRVPLHSARHHAGERLYEYARRGEDAPRPETVVRIAQLALLGWCPGNPARGLLDVVCGSGTYVRALCEDIGRACGVGGHMGALIRYSAGGFDAAQCVTLEEIDQASPDWGAHCVSPASALAFLPGVTVDPAEARFVRDGRPPGPRVAAPEAADGLIRVLDADGGLLAIARRTVSDGVEAFRLEKVLA